MEFATYGFLAYPDSPPPPTAKASLVPSDNAIDEAKRLQGVRRYDILDTPPDGVYDRIATLAARSFKIPIAIITVVDTDRIRFRSRHGPAATETALIK
jgi:phosphoserine phosphatase RsbU/P